MKISMRSWRVGAGVALMSLASGGFAQNPQDAQRAQAAQVAQAAPAAPAAAQEKIYKNEQLDQMMAPVALYPDALLAQLLMACTYPSDVAEAVAWNKANPKADGDAAVKQVEDKDWDPSVKSLVAFPAVLAQFGTQPDWVQKVGDAFLAQPEDVMAAVQRLRAQAQKAGNLKTTEQQKVIVEQAPADSKAGTPTIIQIEPANPEVVYVPQYESTVYGAWPYPSYPPYYYPPPPYYYPYYHPVAAGIAFGIGIAAIGSIWGGCNWGGGNVNINVNKFNNINGGNRISGSGNANWNHNAANRRGTPYADNRSRQNYDKGVGGANQRSQYRGGESAGNRDASRQRAQQSFDRSTGTTAGSRGTGDRGGANAGSRGSGANAGNRASGANAGNRSAGANAGDRSGGANAGNRSAGGGGAQRSQSGSNSNAFSGASSSRSSSSQASRGQSSQRSASSGAGRSSGGSSVSRSSPSRGGGGGSRGGGGGGRRR